MNKKERHAAILRLIGERPDAAVPDLSRAAGVSEVTIRKDLQQLEREGRIVRSYGRISLPPARPDGACGPRKQDRGPGVRETQRFGPELRRDRGDVNEI